MQRLIILFLFLNVCHAQDITTENLDSILFTKNESEVKKNKFDLYIGLGKVNSNYKYLNSVGLPNKNVGAKTGEIFELGIKNILELKRLNLGLEIELINYNAIGNNDSVLFEWETLYGGLNSISNLKFPISKKINMHLDFGLGLQHIISGNQILGNEVFNLFSNNEFDGLFSNLKFNSGLSFVDFNKITAGLFVGYNYSSSLDNNSTEKLNFSSFHIKIRLCSKN